MKYTVPVVYDSLDRIKKRPSKDVIKDAMKIGIKECYSETEFVKLNRNNDITRITKGDIFTFVVVCHEMYDQEISKK